MPPPARWRHRLPPDLSRLVSKALCVLFGLIGALPLGAAFLIKTSWVQAWASAETARVIAEVVGVDAGYRVELTLLPFELRLDDVVVAGNDGAGPALRAASVRVAPRPFALLGGRLDVGEVEVTRPRLRLIVEDGKLSNVTTTWSSGSSNTQSLKHWPFRIISLTDAEVDLMVDGMRASVTALDLDLLAQPDESLELLLRVGESTLSAPPLGASEAGPTPAYDSDRLCQLEARVRWDERGLLVRRLAAIGSADIDPTPGSDVNCRLGSETPEGRVALRAEALRYQSKTAQQPARLEGEVMLRAPLELANRIGGELLPWGGWVGLTGALRWTTGDPLPGFSGRIKTSDLWYGPHRVVDFIDGPIEVIGDRVLSPELKTGYAGGKVRVLDFQLEPLEAGVPLRAGRVVIKRVPFVDLMRDTYVTKDAIVDFMIDDTVVENFHGTTTPLVLDGDLRAFADGFQILSASHRDPTARRLFGINSRTSVVGKFGVRLNGLHFDDETVTFGNSQLNASVRVGFANWIELEQPKGHIDLADVSPLVTLPMAGMAQLETTMGGPRDDPQLKSTLSVEGLQLAGFPIGDLEPTALRFRPLVVDVDKARVKKGASVFELAHARFDFQSGPALLLNADLDAADVDIRDFLAMWHLDHDPRWEHLTGEVGGSSRLRFVIGGKDDPCKGGRLFANGRLALGRFAAFGEGYDSGEADVAFDWLDPQASQYGMTLRVPSFVARKAEGIVLGTLDINPGATVHASVVGSRIPLSRVDALGALGAKLGGTASFNATFGGRLDALEADFKGRLGPVFVGRHRLPESSLSARLVPRKLPQKAGAGKTSCGYPVSKPFDELAYAVDEPTGDYYVSGSLFGSMIRLEQMRIDNARSKHVAGVVKFDALDLTPLLRSQLLDDEAATVGTLTGRVEIEDLPLDDWSSGSGLLEVDQLQVGSAGLVANVLGTPRLVLGKRRLNLDKIVTRVTSPDGYSTVVDVGGQVDKLGLENELDLRLELRPVELVRFESLIGADGSIAGTLAGVLELHGPLDNLRQEGGVSIRGGEFEAADASWAITDGEVDVVIEGGALTIQRAQAVLGGGLVRASGSAPLRGLSLGTLRGEIQVEDARLPLGPDLLAVADANLEGQWELGGDETEQRPNIKGTVTLESFEYSRPVNLSADIAALTGQRGKTTFEHYDPALDKVNFDLSITARQALRINNNLIEARLSIDRPGLQLQGTNQRYGVRGRVQVEPGGRIHFRRNEFEVTSGEVRFDDPTEVAPRVDLRAYTDYRRFSNTTATGSHAAQAVTGASAMGAAAGQWRIAMHAYGDVDELKLDLSSQPELSQDDIFLLLTLGLTRAELDQANLQGTVALEALGSLTGADSVVRSAIPVIDEFRFGSAYSARTGRSEPTVTIGKRLTERLRAYVTTGLTESREVRSNVEWRLDSRTSVESSYDNINDISSSNVGNIGADVRWRLEFD